MDNQGLRGRRPSPFLPLARPRDFFPRSKKPALPTQANHTTPHPILLIVTYTLSDLGDLSNLIGSLSRTI